MSDCIPPTSPLKWHGGKVLLSGYRSPLYDQVLCKWWRRDFELPNNAAGGDSKRRMVESVWMNYDLAMEASP